MTAAGLALEIRGDELWFEVKAVPGAARDRVVGLFGDALKVQVSAPPEGGAANRRLVEVLAEALGVAARDVRVRRGAHHPRKTVAVRGVSRAELENRLMLSTTAR